jgi:hypothetical protein
MAMKRMITSALLGSLLALETMAVPLREKAAPQTWEQRLATYVDCPDILQKKHQGGVVVISFRINADNRLARLKVFSQDEQFNNDLIRQLTGKRLNAPESELEKTHIVRLRFKPE